jgi:hypothetical protein
MPLELVNTIATLGTFLVIAATAVAAIVQLRHARGSNHIACLNELRETIESPDFLAAQRLVESELPLKLQDPVFRYQFTLRAAARSDEFRSFISEINVVGNFFESMGVLAKTGLVDSELVLQMWTQQLLGYWNMFAPLAAIYRRRQGDSVWENFEYLAVMAQDWNATHPKGSYPGGVRRIDLKDEWLEADMQYVASLAPA